MIKLKLNNMSSCTKKVTREILEEFKGDALHLNLRELEVEQGNPKDSSRKEAILCDTQMCR